jgi:hypothetical protein
MHSTAINESDEIKFVLTASVKKNLSCLSHTQGVCAPQIMNHQLERPEGNKRSEVRQP